MFLLLCFMGAVVVTFSHFKLNQYEFKTVFMGTTVVTCWTIEGFSYSHELKQNDTSDFVLRRNYSHIFHIWMVSFSYQLNQNEISNFVSGSNCFTFEWFLFFMNWLNMSLQTWFMGTAVVTYYTFECFPPYYWLIMSIQTRLEAAVVIWIAYYSLELSQYVVCSINLGFWELL